MSLSISPLRFAYQSPERNGGTYNEESHNLRDLVSDVTKTITLEVTEDVSGDDPLSVERVCLIGG